MITFKTLHSDMHTCTHTESISKLTRDSRHQPQRSEHPEGSESLDVQASWLSCSMVGLPRLVFCHALTQHT